MNQSEFRNIFETWKVSLTFAYRNYLSFFLAILGVIVITVTVFVIIVFVFSLPWLLSVGPLDDLFEIFDVMFGNKEGMELVGVVIIFGSALLAPFLIAFGALFGMGQEIIESGGTSSEGVLLWYKRKFVKLAAGGIIQFCIIVIPIALIYLGAFQYFQGTDPTPSELATLLTIGYTWIAISGGIFSMMFPSLIDGLSVPSALKRSVNMAGRYFGSVFSVWIVFLSSGTLLLGPFILQAIFDVLFVPEFLFEVGIILAAIVVVFVVTPVCVLATSRTYLLLSSYYDDYEAIDDITEEEN